MVGEFFESRTVERIDREKFRVEEAGEYLARLNAAIRAGNQAAAPLLDEALAPR
jgi:hypothetical protein